MFSYCFLKVDWYHLRQRCCLLRLLKWIVHWSLDGNSWLSAGAKGFQLVILAFKLFIQYYTTQNLLKTCVSQCECTTSLAGAGWVSTVWSLHGHHVNFSRELATVVCMSKSISPLPDHVLLTSWQQKANKMKHYTDYLLFCVLWELGILYKLQIYFLYFSCSRET